MTRRNASIPRRTAEERLTSLEVQLHVTDLPGVDEAEDAGVQVAVLHASNLRDGATESTVGRHGDKACPSIGMS